jgi:hypothetical protein
LKIEAWLTNQNLTIVAMATSMKLMGHIKHHTSHSFLSRSRYKMSLIEFYYPRIYKDGGKSEIMEFNRVLRVLYAEYAMKYQNLQQMVRASDAPIGALGNGDDEEDSEFRQFLLEKSQLWRVKSDLDQYIDRLSLYVLKVNHLIYWVGGKQKAKNITFCPE